MGPRENDLWLALNKHKSNFLQLAKIRERVVNGWDTHKNHPTATASINLLLDPKASTLLGNNTTLSRLCAKKPKQMCVCVKCA